MAKFVLLYLGGTQPQSQEEGEKLAARWMTWFGAAGGAITDPGNAFGSSDAVGIDRAPSGVNGYTVIDVVDAAAAKKLVADHPHLADGGRIEIHETLEM